MKKKLIVLLLTSVTLTTAACGNTASTGKEQPVSQNESVVESERPEDNESIPELDSAGDIKVDEGIFDVELTIPAEYVGKQTQEDLDKLSEEHGFKSIVLNEDGSATYTMNKKQHKELLNEYRAQISESLNKMIASEEYPNITNIEANDNFTEFTVTTKNTELDLAESFSVMAFYVSGGLYSAFSGEKVDNISVTFINADSGDVITTTNSSDMGEAE